MAKKKITEVVGELLEDFMVSEGYYLYNTEFIKEGRDWFLRVYVDLAEEKSIGEDGKEKYIGTEDCEKVSRFLSEKLDESDPIEQNYYLEVSSPGMDRALITPEHYRRYIGKDVEIKLYKGIDGTKKVDGVLKAFEEGEEDSIVTLIDYNEKEWKLPLSAISKAKLAVIF